MFYILFLFLFFIAIAEASSEGYCSLYYGKICKKYVDNTRSVWYDSSGGSVNEEITTGLWEELIVTLEEPCRSAAEKLICIYAFPECNVNRPLPLCYEDCVAVKELFCYKEWALIEDRKAQKIHVKSRATSVYLIALLYQNILIMPQNVHMLGLRI